MWMLKLVSTMNQYDNLFCVTLIALMGALVNSMVHTIMYTYYGLTAFGPTIRKYIGKYKKRVTQLQLVSQIHCAYHTYIILYMSYILCCTVLMESIFPTYVHTSKNIRIYIHWYTHTISVELYICNSVPTQMQ